MKKTIFIMIILVVLISVFAIVYAQDHEVFGTRLLSRNEVLDLEIGTKVWVEYNPSKVSIWSDEAMIREEKSGKGSVLRNNSGYWELSQDWYFGTSYRVWLRPPAKWHSFIIPWSNTPW